MDGNSRHVTIQELDEGIARWRPVILGALRAHTMTVANLVGYLLAEYYGNIDKESDLILAALDSLNRSGEIKIDRFSSQGVFLTTTF